MLDEALQSENGALVASDASMSDSAVLAGEAGHPAQEAKAQLKQATPEHTETLEKSLAQPLKAQLEALLIIAETPQSVVELATVMNRPKKEVAQALAELRDEYDGANGAPKRGFELREIAGGWRVYARAEFDALIAHAVQEAQTQRLSQAALETLTVIAYKQPISRGAVAGIRAVNVDSVVRTLVNRGLVTEVAQDPETGAGLYGTTPAFLEHLGLNSIEELPPVVPLLEDGADGFAQDGGIE